ncbi:uncharacterized protein LOC127648339 [Xyrauchen texanus]|uniref:uncharacterized protein LOC127648339 n=1 Tax=Xyrauchen texanus TaxID=154827 RepID=UPI0022429019|nr:uncharacterized protein LOC127648339 [Xyrauchen texanus]
MQNFRKEKRPMHVTVLKKGEKPRISRCTLCCDKYHCPYCETWVYKPRELNSVANHVQNHLKLAFQQDEFIIVKCNLKCRENAHFHCCYCPATVLRKVQLRNHLLKCKQKVNIQCSQSSAAPATQPSTSAQTALQPPHPATALCMLTGPCYLLCTPLSPPQSLSQAPPLPSALMTSVQTAPRPQSSVPPSPRVLSPHMPPTAGRSPSGSRQVRIKCAHCGIEINKKNLRVHIQRKHTDVKATTAPV